MAKQWIDGEVYDVPDDEEAERTIEDVLYGESEGAVLYDTIEEFSLAGEEYAELKILSRLAHTEEGKLVQAIYDREAKDALKVLGNDNNLDYLKHAKLAQDHICKKYARDRFRQMVENATSVQKPILRKK